MRFWQLSPTEQNLYRLVDIFFVGKLRTRDAVEWAVRLKPTQRAERQAILELIHNDETVANPGPWFEAWTMIEESWENDVFDVDRDSEFYRIRQRVDQGERSGALARAIVRLVEPYLRVDPLEDKPWRPLNRHRSVTSYRQMMSTTLTSGELLDQEILPTDDQFFLKSLVSELDAAVERGIARCRQLGWPDDRPYGYPSRVYYIKISSDDELIDPDQYAGKSLGPAVKLLHEATKHLTMLNKDAVLPIIARWERSSSSIHARLWSAFARDREIASDDTVTNRLVAMSDREFWKLDLFPEICELRTHRFSTLQGEQQHLLIKRLKKGPPRSLWRGKFLPGEFKATKRRWIAREFRRIELQGGVLSDKCREWLESEITDIPELIDMSAENGLELDTGILIDYPASNDANDYDDLEGAVRLEALEKSLNSKREGWGSDPWSTVNTWLQSPQNRSKILEDLVQPDVTVSDYFSIIGRMCQFHTPLDVETSTLSEVEQKSEFNCFLKLLADLSQEAVCLFSESICTWLFAWNKHLTADVPFLTLWHRLWVIEVDNVDSGDSDPVDSNDAISNQDSGNAAIGSEVRYSPLGKLVSVFVVVSHAYNQRPNTFVVGSPVREMRDVIENTSGVANSIARRVLMQNLPYLLNADQGWTEANLTAPLFEDNPQALDLWSDLSGRRYGPEVLKIIGEGMINRSADLRLDVNVRKSFIFNLVLELLFANKNECEPVVSKPRVQQALREADAEVRAYAADTLRRFVSDLSEGRKNQPVVAAELFRVAIAPFLSHTWPKELSLLSESTSEAFAKLPGVSGNAFSDAVEHVERYLYPFSCYSLSAYKIFTDNNTSGRFSAIHDRESTLALLKLLDLTIGRSDGAVVPHDLSDALDQIRTVVPTAVNSQSFGRLSTIARRR